MRTMAADKVVQMLKGVRKRDLRAFLDTDKRVREWLASGAVLSTKQAAEELGVERTRLWKWEQAGKVTRVYDAGATPLYMRYDLEQLVREDPPQRRRRRAEEAEAEPASAA